MGIFCKKSINAAIDHLKKSNAVATKEDFWNKLSETITKSQTHRITFESSTLRKYLHECKNLNEPQISAIKEAAHKLGVSIDLIDDQVRNFVMDASFLNLEYTIHPKDRGKNRIELDVEEEGEHSVTLRRGYTTINFGSSKHSPKLYAARVFPNRCQIQIKTNENIKFIENDTSVRKSPFRYIGNPSDTSITQWDASDLSKEEVYINCSLGKFSGRFTKMDKITVLTAKNDLKLGNIENIFNSETPIEIDEQLAKQIHLQKEAVLNKALEDALADMYPLVVLPLINSE